MTFSILIILTLAAGFIFNKNKDWVIEPKTAEAATNTLGNLEGGIMFVIGGGITGSVYTATENGTAQSISVKLFNWDGVERHIKGAIYKHSDLSLLGDTEEATIANEWAGEVTMNLNSPVSIVSGTDYLIVSYNDGGGMFFGGYLDDADPNKAHQLPVVYGAWPDPLAGSSHAATNWSIYTTYEVLPTGIAVSGTCDQYDQTSDCSNGETVRVAVNGVLDLVHTDTTDAGAWSISSVGAVAGDVITIFIDGVAAANEAGAVTKYDGTGDISGVRLYEEHLSIGSDDNQTITNADIGQYDNSVSGDEDVFWDVNASNDLTVDATGQTVQDELYVVISNIYRPDSTSSGNLATTHLENNGTITADGNTLDIAGNWDNNATFTANTSIVNLNGSGLQTISAGGTGAGFDFNNVTISNSSVGGVSFADSANVTGTFTNSTAGSRTIFNAGSTYTFTNIVIDGAAGSTIKMVSSASGSPWIFNVTNPPVVSFVEASDSNASGGSQVDDSAGGVDLGNNSNWIFPVGSVVVTPTSATLDKGARQQFSAKAYGAGGSEILGQVFTWSTVVGGGTIDNAGLFTAGSTAGTFSGTVKATTGIVSGYASVTVSPGQASIGRDETIPPVGGRFSPDDETIVTPPADQKITDKTKEDFKEEFSVRSIFEKISKVVRQIIITMAGMAVKIVVASSKNTYVKAITTAIAVATMTGLGMVTIIGVVATQMTIKDFLLVFANFFLSAFAIRRKDKYGMVYDAETAKPIAGALIFLYDAKTVEHVASAVTDKSGHFIFTVRPGNYTISVIKPGYIFPSKLAEQTQRFSNIYRGQIVTVSSSSPAINVQIPIDIDIHAESFKRKVIPILNAGTLRLVSLIFGSVITLTALVLEPKLINYIMAVVFGLMWTLQFVILNRILKFSTVLSDKDRKPIDLAIVRVVTPEGKYVQTYVTDQNGKVLPNIEERGQKILIQKTGFDPKEFEANNQGLVERKRFRLGKNTAEGSSAGSL